MRLGFLGAGRIALHHAAAFRHHGATIVAGCARSDQSKSWADFSAKTGAEFRSAEAQLIAEDIDALVVCLPPQETAAYLQTLLASPKAALIEKPVSPPRRDCAGPNKLIGYNRRYYRILDPVRARLADGGLLAVHANLPGAVNGAAIHGLDLLFHLLGPLTWKYARRNGMAETASGIPVSIAMYPDDPVNLGIRLLFGDGSAWQLSPLETLSIHRGFEVSAGAIRRYKPKLIDRKDEPEEFKPGFLAQAAAFLSGDYGPGARPGESVRLMEFLNEIH